MERLKQRLDNYNRAISNALETQNEYKKNQNKFMMMALIQIVSQYINEFILLNDTIASKI